jgi:D-lactate dehydrogenase
MKVVVFEVEEREAKAFERIGTSHRISFVKEPLRAENAANFADAELVSTFIYSKMGREVLERMPALKMIATRSTGYEHIDIDYCRRKEIVVANVPTYGENTVAEHVFALLLGICHRLPEAIERARSGRFSPEGLQGVDLAGKTLGVVGTGNIGRHVIRIAKGFSMDVVAHDVQPDMQLASEYGFGYVDFKELLKLSDVISLHVPATAETHNLLSFDAFVRMKDGVVVINTARGSLIDSHALIMALRSGKVAGAGLDVLPDEPLIREEAELICSIYEGRHDLRDLVADHILLHMPNVIVTPHSAFNTREAIHRIVETTVDNIRAFLDRHPQNVVGGTSRTQRVGN